jgi:hypothetical protein
VVAPRAGGAGRPSPRFVERAVGAAAELVAHGLAAEARDLRLTAARVEAAGGRIDSARSRLRRIRTPGDASIVSRTLAREVRAEVAARRGDDTGVLRQARGGLDDLAAWQAAFGSHDLQSSFAMHGRSLVLRGVHAALATGRADVVFDWSERARHIASHAVVPRPPEDPRVASAVGELRLLAGNEGAGVRHRESELRELVRSLRWEAGGADVAPTYAGLHDAQSALAAAGAVLIAYLWDGDGLSALVVTPGQATVVGLGPVAPSPEQSAQLQAELDLAAGRLGGRAGAAVQASLDGRLEELSQRLAEPVLAIADRERVASRLVIVAPGILAGMPWTMLPALSGRRLTLPTSATRWVALSAARRALAGRAGFVVGPGVDRGHDEAVACSGPWSVTTVLSGADATTERAAALAASVDVLHLIGHGRHAGDNPHFSGIELADGPWFGYDIEGLTHVPHVVLLSACELGRSSVDWGHEALGMARTWLHAGTRCVLASPSNVNDEDARALLPEVHARLSAGEAPADALAFATRRTGIATPFLSYGAGW